MMPSTMIGCLLVFAYLNEQTYRHVFILAGFFGRHVFWVHTEINWKGLNIYRKGLQITVFH